MGQFKELADAVALPTVTSFAPYGLCPTCGARGVNRERRIDGDDQCENGHHYKSVTAWRPSFLARVRGLSSDVLDASVSAIGLCPKCGAIAASGGDTRLYPVRCEDFGHGFYPTDALHPRWLRGVIVAPRPEETSQHVERATKLAAQLEQQFASLKATVADVSATMTELAALWREHPESLAASKEKGEAFRREYIGDFSEAEEELARQRRRRADRSPF